MKIIGSGSYSKVLMVENKRNQRVYAMKVIEKKRAAVNEVIHIFYINNSYKS